MSLYHIIFSKKTERNVNNNKLNAQLAMMRARAQPQMVAAGLTHVESHFVPVGGVGSYSFDAVFVMQHSGLDDVTSELGDVATAMNSVGHIYGWEFFKAFKDAGSDTAVGDFVSPLNSESEVSDSDISLGEAAPYFSHLFERNAQISIVLSAIDAARSTHFSHRFSAVLFGPPGSGKSAICGGIMEMVGENHILRFDGPSCTKAGLENFFLDGGDLTPKIMVFEEIEKTDPEALKIMLGILDTRGEIRKTTGDEGQRIADVKVLCIATVNNLPLFEKLHAGALSSRFTHKIHCPRPSRKCLESILEREVASVGGKCAWIAPALDYVLGEEGCTDPRRAIAVCLSGRDRLLTGAYQRALRSIQRS